MPYCLTIVARTGDLHQYADGLITTKGLLINSEIYLGNPPSPGESRRQQISNGLITTKGLLINSEIYLGTPPHPPVNPGGSR